MQMLQAIPNLAPSPEMNPAFRLQSKLTSVQCDQQVNIQVHLLPPRGSSSPQSYVLLEDKPEVDNVWLVPGGS